MKRNLRYIGILFLAAILSGCGRASEGAPAETPTETLAIVTETQTSELSTASDALVETTVPQTTTLPETTEATTETTEAPTESEPTDRPPQLLQTRTFIVSLSNERFSLRLSSVNSSKVP